MKNRAEFHAFRGQFLVMQRDVASYDVTCAIDSRRSAPCWRGYFRPSEGVGGESSRAEARTGTEGASLTRGQALSTVLRCATEPALSESDGPKGEAHAAYWLPIPHERRVSRVRRAR